MSRPADKTMKEKLAEEMIDRTPLGTLQIIRIYDVHDNGAVLSCQNESGQIFIARLVEYHKKSSNAGGTKSAFERWHYIPVTRDQLKQYEENAVALYDLIFTEEYSWIYEVSKDGGYIYKDRRITVRDMTINELPERESYVEGINFSFAQLAKDVQKKVKTITNEYGAENYCRDSGEDNISASSV